MHLALKSKRNHLVREKRERSNKGLEYVIFSTAGSIVYNWSIRQIKRRLPRIFMDPLDTKCKTSKIRLNS